MFCKTTIDSLSRYFLFPPFSVVVFIACHMISFCEVIDRSAHQSVVVRQMPTNPGDSCGGKFFPVTLACSMLIGLIIEPL